MSGFGFEAMARMKARKRGFTLVELMVAMGLFVVVLLSAGLIFKMSINTHRAASANAEIMQKLRAVTEQLNTDFRGLRKDMPLLIWFQQDAGDPNQRYDQIMFFADGDFQSIQQYDEGTGEPIEPNNIIGVAQTIVGSGARIHYGQAQIKDANGFFEKPEQLKNEEKRILARRCHIFMADKYDKFTYWPDPNNNLSVSFDADRNERYEHDEMGMARWKLLKADDYKICVIPVSFDERPQIVTSDASTYHKLMCEGVTSLGIQWGYFADGTEKKLQWFPSNDPDGDGSDGDSHFTAGENSFGVYFGINDPIGLSDWYSMNHFTGKDFELAGYPKAIKFTFRLCDSKGIIKEYDVKTGQLRKGRLFTYIVSLD